MQQAEAPFTPPKRPLDFNAPRVDFTLPALEGRPYSTAAHQGKVLVVTFWSAVCPISQQYDAYFNGFARSYGPKGVAFVAVNSNADEDEALVRRAVANRYIAFLILRDADNLLADYFRAETTPHIFVFDPTGLLRYRGAVDNRTGADAPTINYLEDAVEALLLDDVVTIRETPPYGCVINRTRPL
jgi:thiol-disulfide isomerase/thioredoxin